MTLSLFTGYYNYWVIDVLFLLGLYGMLVKPNLVKKLISMNVMQVAVILFFLSLGQKHGATPPILLHAHSGVPVVDEYANPLPHALMLTAVVVSLSTTGVALALLIRIKRRYASLEEPEILRSMSE